MGSTSHLLPHVLCDEAAEVLANDEAFAALKESDRPPNELENYRRRPHAGPRSPLAWAGRARGRGWKCLGSDQAFRAPATERALAMAAGQLRSLAPVR